MSVDSLISIEPVHTLCMHARIQNILSEGVVREDLIATKNGPSSAHQRNAIVDNGPPLNAGLAALRFLEDPDQYCLETLYFCDFSGGSRPLSPLWIRPWHASERRYSCLKYPFQRVVIIGRKVGLDYNSWYACLPLIRHARLSSGSKLFANFDSRS